MPLLEIFSQGEEVITGQIVDGNAAWLARQGVELGFRVSRVTAVGDKLADLKAVLLEIAERADCCLCTGGLGPTTDDLTAEAVSVAFNLPLEFDEAAYSQIQAFFQARNRPMAECNRKQAMLPKGAVRIDNKQGTAPGFALQGGNCWFVFMPGVPSEMKAMFSNTVYPQLLRRFDFRPARLTTIKTVGVGESDLQERLKPIIIPASVQTGFRADLGEVQVKLQFPNDYPKPDMESLIASVVQQIGDPVYSIAGPDEKLDNLPDLIGRLMEEQSLSLTIMETLSHGLVASKFPGANWLRNAIIEPMPPGLIQRFTIAEFDLEFSAVLRTISEDLKNQNQTDLVLVQAIIININLALDSDHPIPVWTGLLAGNDFFYRESSLAGGKIRKQNQAAVLMLDVLRRYLQKKPI